MSQPAERRSARKRNASTRYNEYANSSPTQKPKYAPKKRKVCASHSLIANAVTDPSKATSAPRPVARRRRIQENLDDELINNDTEEEKEDFEHTLLDENQELAESVIRLLNVAKEEVAVAEAYKSEDWDESQNIEAFAQISGRKWTFFVRDVKIVIGRDGREGEAQEVHIDLGPSKLISRQHAAIFFDQNTEGWHVSVHGRNGVRINEHQVRKNEAHRISSGDILEIAGTQMLFQLAGQPLQIAPFFLDKLYREQGRVNDEAVADPQSRPDTIVENASTKPNAEKDSWHITSTPQPKHERPRTPEPSIKREPAASGKKRSPYKRGMMMESTEQIDYSLDSSKDIKPACSYASMITWAILSTSDEALSLNGIYEWIKQHYAYYRLVPSGWQNSIRHNLSLNTNFKKVPRKPDEPGKGMKWTFVPENRETTINAAKRNASKGGGRTSSAPGSPSGPSTQGTFALPERSDNIKTSPTQRTPPLSTYPSDRAEASTPSHDVFGQDIPTYARNQGQLPVLSDETSPVHRRFSNGRLPHVTGSSPTLTSSYGNHDLATNTPAPRAFNLPPPQPNTVKLPTSHMTPTTPAPFWKPMAPAFGSTPARWDASSPVKNVSTIPLSSSPPPGVGNGLESPTRRVGSSQTNRLTSSAGPSSSFGNNTTNGNGVIASNNGTSAAGSGEDLEGGIDLLK